MLQCQSIPRTRELRNRFKTRCKFILGKPVKIGESYDDAHAVHGFTTPTVYKARCYNEQYKLLTVESIDHSIIMLLSGDMAVWHDELYADDVYATITVREPIDKTIQTYAVEYGITEITAEVAASALTARYPKIGISVWEKVTGVKKRWSE